MKSIVVASSRAHARAMLRWSKDIGLDETCCDVALYGEPITRRYAAAILARPVGEILEDHHLWVTHILRPMINGAITTFPGWDVSGSPPLLLEDTRGRPSNVLALRM